METTVIVGAAGSGCRPHRSLSIHLHLNCETDRLGPLPFDKFLARQNREFRVVTHRLATRRPCELTPAARSGTTPPRPAASSWPHIGDIAPVPPQDPVPRLRTVYQFLPPARPGSVVDLLL